MLTTAVLILALLGGVALAVAMWVLLLKLGARWARVKGVTTGRAVLVLLASIVAQLLVSVPIQLGKIVGSPAIGLGIVFGVMVPVTIVAVSFRASWWRALVAWLPTLLGGVFGLWLALFVVRPFLIQSFKISGNSMAPTLLARHFSVPCPVCGRAAYGSIRPADMPASEYLTICEAFHVHESPQSANIGEADYFMVARYLRPRRWDIIAFHYPSDPTIDYVKRVVGLPGEAVVIKDGSIWINGRRLEPPATLSGLKYVTDIPHIPPGIKIAGTPENPAVLGPGEYFVLGDFSEQSSDSRLWSKGAPGHPAYAVPESCIIGVATHIYWPPSRWRILR